MSKRIAKNAVPGYLPVLQSTSKHHRLPTVWGKWYKVFISQIIYQFNLSGNLAGQNWLGLKNFSLSIKVITVKLKLIQLLAQFSSVCGEDCIHVHTWEKKKNKQFKTFLPHLPNTDLYSLYLRTRKFSFLFLTFVVFHMQKLNFLKPSTNLPNF